MIRWSLPLSLVLLGLVAAALPACEEVDDSVYRKSCDPIPGSITPASGSPQGGFEITLGGHFLSSAYSSYGVYDTAVHVGGQPAVVLDVDGDGCGPCESCLLEAEACTDCLDVCRGEEAYGDDEAEECVETVVVEAPAGAPGEVAVAVFNSHGATDGYRFTYLGWCDDGEDNDGDGLVDAEDPGCAATGSQGETGTCENQEDDDGDGWIDLDDPGCADDAAGSSEEGGAASQCNNGLDDDGDGLVDAEDEDCDDGYDDDEFPPPQNCDDGVDNDGDGWTDLADPECQADPASEQGWGRAQCNDGVDDDGDGQIDAEDPDCTDGADDDESR